MPDNNELLKHIMKNPEAYLEYEKKSLDDRIAEIKLSEEQKNQARIKSVTETGGNTIKAGLSLLTNGGSDMLFEVLSWKKKLDQNMDDTKKSILMAEYLNKFDTIEQGVESLERVVSDLYGQTLFSKIDNMVEDNPLDEEIIKKLSNVMKTISDSGDFESIFTSAKQVLNLVDKLSPMSLYMIGDSPNWPDFKMDLMMSMGGSVSGFESYFVDAYKNKNLRLDRNAIETAVNEMSSSGLIFGAQIEESNLIRTTLTNTGRFLLDSIS